MTATPEEINDGMARINAVTDALTGPLRVWTLLIHGDVHPHQVHICYSKAGALQLARADMETGFKEPPSKELIDAAIADLGSNHCVEMQETRYDLDNHEVQS